MNEPPVMVSTKDCMYISDILNVMVSLIKKLRHYDNEIQDEQIKNHVSNVANQLNGQFNSLTEVLNNG